MHHMEGYAYSLKGGEMNFSDRLFLTYHNARLRTIQRLLHCVSRNDFLARNLSLKAMMHFYTALRNQYSKSLSRLQQRKWKDHLILQTVVFRAIVLQSLAQSKSGRIIKTWKSLSMLDPKSLNR